MSSEAIILTTAFPQIFTLSLGGVTYTIRLAWCSASYCWVIDIGDQTNVPIAQGLPFITGHTLLAQYEYLGIAGDFIVQTDHAPDTPPTFQNLGSTGHLYYLAPLS